ncbi:MAG TPA: PilW family protein [Zoogloea sp.]|uniref:PilW family protein n=1 Tax=Zoogloea sp. TaxID=49181 RepID=UPI002CA12F41|nr:PilW family protein [Zoogloea sp.]HMV16765.1 PilW family protein [Rhodocyclaceae bacterium]HMV64287.1 PilW family protein [Rhodocyclaceae bacterium]HMW50826.1 PilW family protein [Rhodocyclaceae bacterium]HMZ74632.1 PilW family protein [Rhodocyclaceae bacterium]HNA67544.1 PilW family protein [Rhodocyclaceae bacterium]
MRRPPFPVLRDRSRQRGISLVETMIGMALGLVATFVIIQSFSSSETYRRNLAGTADATQTAAIAGGHLDLVLQEAGASLVQGRNVWGCKILVTRNKTAILPHGSNYPSPFASFPTTVRVLPLAVLDGGDKGSDVIMAMVGNSGTGNRDTPFSAPAGGKSMVVSNNNGMALTSSGQSPNDLFLSVPQEVAGAPGDCQVVQADSSFSNGTAVADPSLGLQVMPASVTAPQSLTTIPLNASTYGALASSANSPSAFHLGRESAPIFSLFAVNSNGELVEYDLLERNGVMTFGENIFLIKARYGLDNGANGGTANDNVIDDWVSPAEDGWKLAQLMDGKSSTEQKVDQIKAVRLALVTRSSQSVTSDAKVSSLTLFSDLSSTRQYTRSLSDSEQAYQYQIVDWVIPLRNMKATPK